MGMAVSINIFNVLDIVVKNLPTSPENTGKPADRQAFVRSFILVFLMLNIAPMNKYLLWL